MKIDAASREPRAPPQRALALAADYWQLVRPRIVGMVLCTLTVSSLVAGPQTPSWPALIHALVGCGLVIVGAIALNGRAERQSDAKMRRTAVRPLPSGRLTAGQAGRFGVAASAGGLVYWGVLGNWTLLGLTAVSWFLYVSLYTPLKPRSAWQTPLGALAGAMPVLLGAATAGTPWSVTAIALFGIVYFWQFPHAMAIAWLYRDQFAAAGLRVASVVDPSGRTAAWIALLGAGLLVPVSLLPWWTGTASWGYGLAAIASGLGYAGTSLHFFHCRDQRSARLLLPCSLVYLVGVLVALLSGVGSRP